MSREAFNLQPEDLGFDADETSEIRLYEHLTPRIRDLLYQASYYKRANQFKF